MRSLASLGTTAHSSPRRVILLGAARSGTKIVRDVLASATGAGVVPYDIGYVWRFGNERRPDDLLEPGAIGGRERRFIQRFVDRYAAGEPLTVIEKTVANTLRVPVVDWVFPGAVYIHLVRDGVDVVESARRQWTAPADLRYLIGKVRHLPVRLAPRYGTKYLRSMVRRRTRGDGRVGTWGPRYPGIDEDLREHDLLVVCARQWRYSVTLASDNLARLGLPVLEVRYERLVQEPAAELAQMVDFLRLRSSPYQLANAARRLYLDRRGTGRRHLTTAELAIVDTEVGDLLGDLGYERPLAAGVGRHA